MHQSGTRGKGTLLATLAFVAGFSVFQAVKTHYANEFKQSEADEAKAAYAVNCYGPPLRTIEDRVKAQEDGYQIDEKYNCISKISYFIMLENEKAAKRDKLKAEARAKVQRETDLINAQQYANIGKHDETAGTEPPPRIEPIEIIDVNTATTAELNKVISLDKEVVDQIVKARYQRLFTSWADMVDRVIGLHAAKNAAMASSCGLTVNGESLPGAPPSAYMAAFIKRSKEE